MDICPGLKRVFMLKNRCVKFIPDKIALAHSDPPRKLVGFSGGVLPAYSDSSHQFLNFCVTRQH